MRLIDADETLRLMEFEEEKYQYEEHYGYREAEKFIASQPTIEAIPVEWIEKWFTEKYRRSVVWWDCAEDVFKAFMEDWRKENEQRKNR